MFPLPALLIPVAPPPPVHTGGPTPSPAGLHSSHTWQNDRGALPVAGGADTTGKDVTVTLTLRTPARFWRNSVSSVTSLIPCLFAVPLGTHPASCSPSGCLILACFFLLNQSDVFAAEMATSKGSAGLYFPRWAERRPTACARACAWVGGNWGHRLSLQGALWPELKEGNAVSRNSELQEIRFQSQALRGSGPLAQLLGAQGRFPVPGSAAQPGREQGRPFLPAGEEGSLPLTWPGRGQGRSPHPCGSRFSHCSPLLFPPVGCSPGCLACAWGFLPPNHHSAPRLLLKRKLRCSH